MFLGTTYLEWSAVIMTTICILLAGRNNVHTWWTGIIACILYGALFFENKLYADTTLQAFFVITGIIGWYGWATKRNAEPLPVTKVGRKTLSIYVGIALAVAAGYGFILHSFTDAFAPWIDSLVLTLSVIAQLMLMRRQLENWPVWLAVNTLAVPLFFSRELYLSAAMYSVFWVNAIVSWRHWLDLYDEANGNLKKA